MDNDVHMEDCPKSDEEFPSVSTSDTSQLANTQGLSSNHHQSAGFLAEALHNNSFLLNASGWCSLFGSLPHNESFSNGSSLSSSSSHTNQEQFLSDYSKATFESYALAFTSKPAAVNHYSQQQLAIGQALFTSPHNLVANGVLAPEALGVFHSRLFIYFHLQR